MEYWVLNIGNLKQRRILFLGEEGLHIELLLKEKITWNKGYFHISHFFFFFLENVVWQLQPCRLLESVVHMGFNFILLFCTLILPADS